MRNHAQACVAYGFTKYTTGSNNILFKVTMCKLPDGKADLFL